MNHRGTQARRSTAGRCCRLVPSWFTVSLDQTVNQEKPPDQGGGVPAFSEFVPDLPKTFLDAPEFVPDGPEFLPDRPESFSDGPKFVPGRLEYFSDRSEFVPDRPEFLHDRPESFSDRPEFVPDGPKFAPDGPEFLPNGPKSLSDGPRYCPGESGVPPSEPPKSRREAAQRLPDELERGGNNLSGAGLEDVQAWIYIARSAVRRRNFPLKAWLARASNLEHGRRQLHAAGRCGRLCHAGWVGSRG